MHRAPPVPVPVGLVGCRALLAYEGPARELLARLKYRNERAGLAWLVAGLVALVQPTDHPVAVTWAPTTVERRRTRGFDQAEQLARRVARRLDLPALRLLDRQPGPPQTGRTHAERRSSGPHFRATTGPRRRAPPGPLLLVDDVVTTGTTLAAAASALSSAGFGPVIGLAAGYTAPPNWSAAAPERAVRAPSVVI